MATRWRFPFAKAVPSDDALAQWVTGLGLGLNDLVHSHKRLFEGLAGDEPTVVEIGYDARLTGSHVWEVSVLLRAGTSNPDLSDFWPGSPLRFARTSTRRLRSSMTRRRPRLGVRWVEPVTTSSTTPSRVARSCAGLSPRSGVTGTTASYGSTATCAMPAPDGPTTWPPNCLFAPRATTTQRSGNSPRSLGTSRGCRCTCWWTSSRSTSARSRTASSRKSRTADRTGLDGVRAGARGFGRGCPGGRVAADVA